MQVASMHEPAPPGNWQTLPTTPQLALSLARFVQLPPTSP